MPSAAACSCLATCAKLLSAKEKQPAQDSGRSKKREGHDVQRYPKGYQLFRSDWILELALVRRRLTEILEDGADSLILTPASVEKLVWSYNRLDQVEQEMSNGIASLVQQLPAEDRSEEEVDLGSSLHRSD